MAIQLKPVSDSTDLDQFLRLMHRHFADFAAVTPDFQTADNWQQIYAEGAREALSNPRHHQVLAIDGEIAVGICVSWWREDQILGQRIGLISELYVTPEKRGLGIGRMLARDAIQWLTATGADQISLRTPAAWLGQGRELTGAAINFWAGLGFRAEALVMRLPVGDCGSAGR